MAKNKIWLMTFAAIGILAGVLVSSMTAYVDPYFHYHKPLTDRYYYVLSNQRSQNDGITKNFIYDGILTGTSMMENARTSEADRIFGGTSIKVCYSGGMFKEINDNLRTALETHPGVRYVVRCLDRYKINADKDAKREDLGNYPTYLYDSNLFNDVEYTLNRDVIYNTIYGMEEAREEGSEPGITSFDDYSRWMNSFTFGSGTVLQTPVDTDDTFMNGFTVADVQESLTDEERELIRENVKQNVTDLADEYPNTEFYYFLPPYSAAFWGNYLMKGLFYKQAEMEDLMISMIVPHKNIHLFAWNRFDLFDDLNNYKDTNHYGEWINSWMLVQMKNDSGRLTEDNYREYMDKWKEHYLNFAYNSLFDQEDYEADYYAGGLLNHEITGAEPVVFDSSVLRGLDMQNASVVSGEYDGTDGIECRGAMKKQDSSDLESSSACYNGDYCGIRFELDVTDYRALTFNGLKVSDHGEPAVYVYDADGKLLTSLECSYSDLDNEWHQYAVNLAGIYGNVTIVINGGCRDNSGASDSEYIFSNIVLY